MEFGNAYHFVDASTAMDSLESWFIARKAKVEVNQRTDEFIRSWVINYKVPDPKALGMAESSGNKEERSEDEVEKPTVRKKVRLKTCDQRLTLLLPVVEQAERLEVIDRLILVRINFNVMLSTYYYVVDDGIESFIETKCTLFIVKSCNSGGGVSVNLVLLLFVTEFHAANVLIAAHFVNSSFVAFKSWSEHLKFGLTLNDCNYSSRLYVNIADDELDCCLPVGS